MIWGVVFIGCIVWAISDASAHRHRRHQAQAREADKLLAQTPAPIYTLCPLCRQMVATHRSGESLATWKFVEKASANHAALHVVTSPSMN